MESMLKNTRGFTIVELLIVIVVIGILAAIVIVAFNGVQGRAQETSVRSDLKNFSSKIEQFRVDSPTESYPTTAGQLDTLGFKASKNGYDTSQVNLLYCFEGSSYAMLALTKNGKKLFVTNEGGIQEYIGTNTWLTTAYNSRCATTAAATGMTTSASYIGGYNSGDTSANGPWRPWVGGN